MAAQRLRRTQHFTHDGTWDRGALRTRPGLNSIARDYFMDDSFTFSETDLPAAIRGLREALGRSPEVMAKILGCSLPAYVKWESGSLTPGGEWLIRLLQICPNEETRNAFRIRAERRTAPRPRPDNSLLRSGSLSSTERLHYLKEARDALDALAECGRSGSASADQRLRDFAENLQNAARYYLSRIKQTSDSE